MIPFLKKKNCNILNSFLIKVFMVVAMKMKDRVYSRLKRLEVDRLSIVELHQLLRQCGIVYKFQCRDWVKFLIANGVIHQDEKNDQVFWINKAVIDYDVV